MLKWVFNQAEAERGIGLGCIGKKGCIFIVLGFVFVALGCGGGGGSGGPPGNIVHGIDSDADGTIDRSYTYTHNAAGQIILLITGQFIIKPSGMGSTASSDIPL